MVVGPIVYELVCIDSMLWVNTVWVIRV